ncbi:hypothetical protein C8046_16765 [Serinibacter arcticus]|uniref:Uncharacterized protein n=1 Tax=Serinibacter arcticus TaxID=1655435 RepID=A0A2U1ZYJ7_9MICO|nr:hypothetical protein C8046_16765 [Serinibacter arcticus]
MERDVMVASFAMRKLLDAPGKISDEAQAERVQVVSHPPAGQQPDFWSRHEFWEMFDLDQGDHERISVRELCNRVIHSVVFSFNGSEEPPHRLDGIFVASDWSSRKSLTYIEVAELVRVLRIYAIDDIVYVAMQRDSDGRMQVTKASREQPPDPVR